MAVTEEALRLLRRTHADHASLEPLTRPGRLHAISTLGALGVYDGDQVRRQGVYLRHVSIVEAFVDSLTAQLFGSRVSAMESFYRLLASAVVADASQSWDNRKTTLKDYVDVPLGDCPSWSQLASMVTVRNAIAHGLGRLTQRQRNSRDRRKILDVGVRLQDDNLQIDSPALDSCLKVCAAFVHEVDARVPLRHRWDS
jgi:hypothetical protein